MQDNSMNNWNWEYYSSIQYFSFIFQLLPSSTQIANLHRNVVSIKPEMYWILLSGGTDASLRFKKLTIEGVENSADVAGVVEDHLLEFFSGESLLSRQAVTAGEFNHFIGVAGQGIKRCYSRCGDGFPSRERDRIPAGWLASVHP